jgi:hypothetical protein
MVTLKLCDQRVLLPCLYTIGPLCYISVFCPKDWGQYIYQCSVTFTRPRFAGSLTFSLLNAAGIEDLCELIHEAPSLFLDEIAEWLAIYHEQPISSTALHDNLHDLELTYKRLRKVAAERDDAYRAAWMYEITSNYTADQIVLLDESSKITPFIVTMAMRLKEKCQLRGWYMTEGLSTASFRHSLPIATLLFVSSKTL